MAALALVVVVVDEATKAIAVHRGGVRINTGVSFGILEGRPMLALALSLTMLGVILFGAVRWADTAMHVLAGGLIIGGAVGNILNRLPLGRSEGAIDWITVPGYPAAFNVADLAIRVGAVIVIVQLIRSGRRPRAGTNREPRTDAEGNDEAAAVG
ncbi:MAG: signal peptidase II [Candidatus Nanopelagicales bacterium]|nr:signal peptidase II [Candidatus Nanopelagicales bacterium]